MKKVERIKTKALLLGAEEIMRQGKSLCMCIWEDYTAKQ